MAHEQRIPNQRTDRSSEAFVGLMRQTCRAIGELATYNCRMVHAVAPSHIQTHPHDGLPWRYGILRHYETTRRIRPPKQEATLTLPGQPERPITTVTTATCATQVGRHIRWKGAKPLSQHLTLHLGHHPDEYTLTVSSYGDTQINGSYVHTAPEGFNPLEPTIPSNSTETFARYSQYQLNSSGVAIDLTRGLIAAEFLPDDDTLRDHFLTVRGLHMAWTEMFENIQRDLTAQQQRGLEA